MRDAREKDNRALERASAGCRRPVNLRQAKKTLAKKVWDAAGMAGGDFAPKWVGQGIPGAGAVGHFL